MVNLAGVFSKFHPTKILLIGDFMLDKYTTGVIKRISPEAPVSVLNVLKDHAQPGGAGNVVLNLLALKADVMAIGRVGRDKEGKQFKQALKKAGANVENILEQKDYPTPVKNRLIAGAQQVLRVDREKILPLPLDLEEILIKRLPSLIKEQQIVAISDYGKGFLSNNLISKIIETANNFQIPVMVDPKGLDFSKYKHSFIIKPNLSEAYAAANLIQTESLEKAAKKLFEKTQAKNMLITRSELGMTLFDQQLNRKDYPVRSKEVQDVTGAGDTVLSTLAVCLANGFNLDVSIQMANIAAGIAIEHIGCVSVSLSDLANRLLQLDANNKIFEERHLFALEAVLKKHQFRLLGLDSKNGLTMQMFTAISKLASKAHCKLLVYLKDKNPSDDFISLLSFLKAIDFIIIKQDSLKSLCEKIHPKEVFEIIKNKPVQLKSVKALF